MSDIAKQKGEVFNRIWSQYNEIKDILLKCEVKEEKLPDFGECEVLSGEVHIDRLRKGEQWLREFIFRAVGPWKKLRAENTEEYWERAKMMGLGKDFKEIKLLAERSKTIRKEWFHQQNFLAPRKKVKEEKKTDE